MSAVNQTVVRCFLRRWHLTVEQGSQLFNAALQVYSVVPRLTEKLYYVALGGVALDSLRRIEPHEAELASHAGRPINWAGRTLVPLYHPSIQATLTRPHERQRGDWRRLGRHVRSVLGQTQP